VRWVLLVEVLVVFLATAGFVALYLRTPWWQSPTGRLIMAWVSVTCAESALFALSYAVRLPMLVFAVVFGCLDAVAVWRLVLLVRVQRRDRYR
jgi:presenilin-like A22 family membrane protease